MSFSCSKKGAVKQEQPEGSYFSIIEFTTDQWATYHGRPYGMVKKVYFNGKEDSTVTNALEVDWASIIKVFFETDISGDKYLGKYDFSAFADKGNINHNFFYEANDPKVYTRSLQVNADPLDNKIKSIYIEAEKSDRMGTKSVKLFYSPLQTISIQELETTKTGQRREMRVVYEFL